MFTYESPVGSEKFLGLRGFFPRESLGAPLPGSFFLRVDADSGETPSPALLYITTTVFVTTFDVSLSNASVVSS